MSQLQSVLQQQQDAYAYQTQEFENHRQIAQERQELAASQIEQAKQRYEQLQREKATADDTIARLEQELAAERAAHSSTAGMHNTS